MSQAAPTLKILIAEDSSPWQGILKNLVIQVLEELNLNGEIKVLAYAAQTCKAIDNDSPWHLLIVDPGLPDEPDYPESLVETGFNLIHYANKKQIPMIVVTGEATIDDAVSLVRTELNVINVYGKKRFRRQSFFEDVKRALKMPVPLQSPSILQETETYIDFDLHVSPNGHAIANSLQGQAVSDIQTEPPNSIRLSLKLIEKRETNSEILKEVGCSLYDWLFPGPIHTHLHQTEAVASCEKAKLRLRLRIEANTIASLPLEFLYRQIGGYYLAVNPDTVLSRYLNLPLPPERVRRREEPLHMLVIIADPTDQTRLPPDEWEIIVKDALAKPLANGQMTLQTVKRATRKEIRNALLQQKPDIIQFIGHGIYQDGKGFLALVDEQTDKTWLVDDEQFAGLYLGHDDNLGLISLATCESAKSDNPQAFQGIAPKLIERGVPAVLSMQYKVLIKTAKVFLEDFYTSVAARKPIDWATQSARNAISQQFGLDNREFATPVLYMRAKDGVVF